MILIQPQYHLSERRNISSQAQSRVQQSSKTLWFCLASMSSKRSSERQFFTLIALLWFLHLLSRFCVTLYQISRYSHVLVLLRRSWASIVEAKSSVLISRRTLARRVTTETKNNRAWRSWDERFELWKDENIIEETSRTASRTRTLKKRWLTVKRLSRTKLIHSMKSQHSEISILRHFVLQKILSSQVRNSMTKQSYSSTHHSLHEDTWSSSLHLCRKQIMSSQRFNLKQRIITEIEKSLLKWEASADMIELEIAMTITEKHDHHQAIWL